MLVFGDHERAEQVGDKLERIPGMMRCLRHAMTSSRGSRPIPSSCAGI
jgi:hypothetical protein